MSEREVNENLDPEEEASDGETHQSDLAEEGGIGPGEPEKNDAKVINKGKAKLIISNVEGSQKKVGEPKVISPKPRIAKVKKPSSESELAAESEDIQRLEREIDPGKERIKVDRANFENREKRPDEAETQEEQWGGGLAPGWWVMIAGACAVVVLLVGLALESWVDGDQAQIIPTPPPRVAVGVDPHAGSPEKWFYERGGLNSDEVNNLLQAFTTQEDDVARSKYVRNPEGYLDKVREWNVKLNPRLGSIEEQSVMISHTEDTAFLVLKCKDSDFMPFRAYFVREGEELKFDWEATVAWSEVSLESIKKELKAQQVVREKAIVAFREERQKRKEKRQQERVEIREEKSRQIQAAADIIHIVKSGENLSILSMRYHMSTGELIRFNQLPSTIILVGQKLKIPMGNRFVNEPTIVIPQDPMPVAPVIFQEELFTEPLLVRCMISRQDEFYAGPYNDREHSVFRLLSPDKSKHLWAYTARDSALDMKLRRLLNHGRFVVALKKNMYVTLRIQRNQKDALPSQVELVEMVHPEWVTP